jgi:hypothetical protein
MNGSLALRASALQAALVIALSLALALALPSSFFDDWGWLSGPAAWFACAALTARVLGLPAAPVLLGALLAGLLSAFAMVLGIHWLGVLIAIAAFAAWCAWIARGGGVPGPRARAGAEV